MSEEEDSTGKTSKYEIKDSSMYDLNSTGSLDTSSVYIGSQVCIYLYSDIVYLDPTALFVYIFFYI